MRDVRCVLAGSSRAMTFLRDDCSALAFEPAVRGGGGGVALGLARANFLGTQLDTAELELEICTMAVCSLPARLCSLALRSAARAAQCQIPCRLSTSKCAFSISVPCHRSVPYADFVDHMEVECCACMRTHPSRAHLGAGAWRWVWCVRAYRWRAARARTTGHRANIHALFAHT